MGLVFLVVAGCALVQSVFGIGLLVLGTPLLLLGGLSFPQALFYLLPCSMLVSALQLRETPLRDAGLRRGYAFFLAPAAVAGAFAVMALGRGASIKPVVGWMLLLTAALRLSAAARERLASALRSRTPAALAAIGLVHGFTNMGGGLLTLFAASVETEKSAIRSAIAGGYLLMAALQLCVLLAAAGVPGDPLVLAALVAVSGLAFVLIGRRVFAAASQPAYQAALTGLLCLMGGVLSL